jgi:hypothetical protein
MTKQITIIQKMMNRGQFHGVELIFILIQSNLPITNYLLLTSDY